MGLVGNGAGRLIYDGYVEECETMMKPLKNSGLIFKAGWFKRIFIDFALKYLLCHRRKYMHLNGLR